MEFEKSPADPYAKNQIDAETKKLCDMVFSLEDSPKGTKVVKAKRVRRNESIPRNLHKAPKSIKCPKCPQRFLTEKLHQQHFLQSHASSVNLCSVCLSIFPSTVFLAKHKGRCFKRSLRLQDWKDLPEWFDISRAKESILPCPVCSEEFSSIEKLLDHLVVHDSAMETFTCGPCSSVFFTMSELKKHMFEHVVADQRKIHTEAS